MRRQLPLLFLAAVSVAVLLMMQQGQALHQTLERFPIESAHCYGVNERPLYGDRKYMIGLRYQNYTHSVETFINLVEKIEEYFEERGRRMSADGLIKVLLRRFHIEGLQKEMLSMFVVNNFGKFRDQLVDVLLDVGGASASFRFEFPPDMLSDEELCTLHYMLTRMVLPLASVQTYSELMRPGFGYGKGGSAGGGPKSKSNGAFNKITQYGINPDSYKHLASSLLDPSREKFDIYEQGVARFRASESDSIELSRVLIGALAGLTNTVSITPFEIYERLQKLKSPGQVQVNLSELRSEKVDPLLVLTLGDIWATWKTNPEYLASSGGLSSTKPNTAWNNPLCAVYFQLQSPQHQQQQQSSSGSSVSGQVAEDVRYTASQLRGGLDGLAIGRALRELRQFRAALKLSQVLKMYYSTRGFEPQAKDSSVCRRNEIMDLYSQQLQVPAAVYLQLLFVSQSKVMLGIPNAMGMLKETQLEFQSKLSDAALLSDSNRVWCSERQWQMSSSVGLGGKRFGGAVGGEVGEGGSRDLFSDDTGYSGNSYGGTSDSFAESQLPGYGKQANSNRYQPVNVDSSQIVCETPVDLLFLVDMSNYANQQLAILTRILTARNMYHKESVTVLANRPGSGAFRNALQVINWRERVKEKTICGLQAAVEEKSPYTITRGDELLNRIEQTLTIYQREQNESLIIPAKAFVLFNFGFIKHDQSQEFHAAKRYLQVRHRSVKFLVIGQGDREDLRSLVVNSRDTDENVFADSAELGSLAIGVSKSVCETPAVVQYPKCNETASRHGDVQRSVFVSPLATKYLIILANQFYSSEDLYLRFSLQSEHNVRICMSRWSLKPEEESQDKRYCKEIAKEQDRHIEFRLQEPCYDEPKDTCGNVYFSVTGLPGGVPDCFEPDCVGVEQIKVDFSHQGMLCNSTQGLAQSLLVALVLQLLVQRIRRKHL